MKALIACEESQTVTIEFRKLGIDAYSCDIEPCSGGHPEWHIQGDVLKVLRPRDNGYGMKDGINFTTMDGTYRILDKKWDMIIAFPPCTFLSNAGACRLYPRKGELDQERYKKGLLAKEFFMKIYNADCSMIAIENPVSSKIFKMPIHSQQIQPYEFGHPYTKKTRLWLRGLPPLIPTNKVIPTGPYIPAGTSRKNKSKYGASRCGGSSITRSKTFPGIAKAMAEQWEKLLIQGEKNEQ